MIKPQPIDISNNPLQGALNGIPDIQNIITYSGVWYPVTLEFEESKQMILQSRDTVDWRYATASGGPYLTLRKGAALELPVVAVSGTVVGWVYCGQDQVFELAVGR